MNSGASSLSPARLNPPFNRDIETRSSAGLGDRNRPAHISSTRSNAAAPSPRHSSNTSRGLRPAPWLRHPSIAWTTALRSCLFRSARKSTGGDEKCSQSLSSFAAPTSPSPRQRGAALRSVVSSGSTSGATRACVSARSQRIACTACIRPSACVCVRAPPSVGRSSLAAAAGGKTSLSADANAGEELSRSSTNDAHWLKPPALTSSSFWYMI
mmetsp:Transcript_10415/g.45214  ORF Transcript_10415/g.45214 Transcript_10415/m.45214 type:complete len:212 (-) Transcript_10415:1682-2317(-)